MRVHNVHSRDLPAPAERAWDPVAGLASDHDELWPTERWPTSPIEFDRPLGPGAEGGHGMIRYAVERYEPGRRVVVPLRARVRDSTASTRSRWSRSTRGGRDSRTRSTRASAGRCDRSTAC